MLSQGGGASLQGRPVPTRGRVSG